MKILITGICGFVGSTLAQAWLEAEPGIEIYGLDNFTRPGSELNRNELIKLGIRFYHGDIRLASDFATLPKVDWVIDAAANPSVLAGIKGYSSSRQLVEHNLIGTVNMLEYCKRNGAGFILLSTSRVYSINKLTDIHVEPEDDAFILKADRPLPPGVSAAGVSESFSTEPPISLYGSTKLASEILALEYGESFHNPVWINRCGVLAGSGQFGRADQGIFAYWLNSWLRKKPLSYIGFDGKGYQVRDSFQPRDLLPLLRKQTSTGFTTEIPKIINLGGGVRNSMSLAQLSGWCRERFGPHEIAAVLETRPFDIPWMVMDSTLAGKTWDWQPQTPLENILEEIALHAEQNPDWLEISGY
ncbi:MAG: NAD-dependent epimerase/dehydratase family protein [Deltaproteobacteria bacterium]|jgi:CDP-paratose 2-epimerase|nr:NAD-dependent epimerase/dehydratase family protein [Deltaproteobacteria bacterium]